MLARVSLDVSIVKENFVEVESSDVELQCPHCGKWFKWDEIVTGAYLDDGVAWRECPICRKDV